MGMLDSLLEEDLSAIADMPTYEVPPKGFYKFLVKAAEEKTVTTKNGPEPILQIDYAVVEALELADPSEAESVKAGMEFSESYFFRNDPAKTKSALKTTFQEVSTTFQCKTLAETISKLAGLEIFAVLNHRKDKTDETKVYAQIRNVKVA